MSTTQAQAKDTRQEKTDKSECNLMGQGLGQLDKKLYEFEEFCVPQHGTFKEVRNEVYVNNYFDKDGKQKFERTFDRSVAHAQDGKLIAERRQRYEDDFGMAKETHERQLDTKGFKEISERNDKGEWVTKHEKRNINNLEEFDSEYHQRNQMLTKPLELKLWDSFPQLL